MNKAGDGDENYKKVEVWDSGKGDFMRTRDKMQTRSSDA